jgi:membrane fusion protein (multidrug efflux system)
VKYCNCDCGDHPPLPILVFVIALATAVGGLGLPAVGPAYGNAEKGVPSLPVVGVVTLEPRDVSPQSVFTGRIEAIDRVDLRARVEGVLEQRLFREGAEVQKGDLLFRIERSPYEIAVAEIQGAITRDEGALSRVRGEGAR